MKASLGEIIYQLPWWAYGLSGGLGILFGIFQMWLVKHAIGEAGPRKGFIVVKLLLWAAALVAWGFVSVPLLVLFTLCATVVLFAGAISAYGKAKREG